MLQAVETASDVTVIFKNAALNFVLPPGATLEDLAARIARIEQRHLGEPLTIDVTLRH